MQAETRTDTATEDAQELAPSKTRLVVPDVFASQGYEAMPFGYGNLWAVTDDQYIYKPLAAWDAAQQCADDVVVRTGGNIYTLASSMMEVMRAVAAIRREARIGEDGEPTGELETDDEVYALRGRIWQDKSMEVWSSFVASCPRFKPAEFAREMIVKCSVRRIASLAEQNKDATDPTRDHAGPIFEVKGAGSVENFYRGRRQQLVRIGLAAFWGSCGDFFDAR